MEEEEEDGAAARLEGERSEVRGERRRLTKVGLGGAHRLNI